MRFICNWAVQIINPECNIMLMPVKIDFHQVEAKHSDIHAELENWARWVKPTMQTWISPMFKQYRSKAWQWHAPEHKDVIRSLDAMKMEKAVYHLPEKNRAAVRWAYVYRCTPSVPMRSLGVSNDGLMMLLRDGRQMLKNRC